MPALVDGDLKLCQSGSILLYLADKFGKMGGKTPEEKARVREWLFWEFDRLAPNVYRPRAVKRGSGICSALRRLMGSAASTALNWRPPAGSSPI